MDSASTLLAASQKVVGKLISVSRAGDHKCELCGYFKPGCHNDCVIGQLAKEVENQLSKVPSL